MKITGFFFVLGYNRAVAILLNRQLRSAGDDRLRVSRFSGTYFFLHGIDLLRDYGTYRQERNHGLDISPLNSYTTHGSSPSVALRLRVLIAKASS
ncbi:hypothetical protein B0H11DRAFT_174167 [Mycena galericulata]|nr:hypothetical protein B0H11DRAFT_174167 [Mycena galericulata]